MTIPWFQVLGGVPLVEDIYFEFETASGELLELHELELGHSYEIIIFRRRACVGTECAISSVWLASSEKPRRLSF